MQHNHIVVDINTSKKEKKREKKKSEVAKTNELFIIILFKRKYWPFLLD